QQPAPRVRPLPIRPDRPATRAPRAQAPAAPTPTVPARQRAIRSRARTPGGAPRRRTADTETYGARSPEPASCDPGPPPPSATRHHTLNSASVHPGNTCKVRRNSSPGRERLSSRRYVRGEAVVIVPNAEDLGHGTADGGHADTAARGQWRRPVIPEQTA